MRRPVQHGGIAPLRQLQDSFAARMPQGGQLVQVDDLALDHTPTLQRRVLREASEFS